MPLPSAASATQDLIDFLNASPSPYHAVKEAVRRLEAAGYRALDERAEWTLAPGDRVYVVKGGGTVVAFALGSRPPWDTGFRLVAAHTDSPNFRVKPKGETRTHGHRQIGVEVYGSPLLHTWLDRDLSLAGRVSLFDGSTHLIRVDRSICRMSSLAIHLSPTLATDGLRLNPQQHLVPTFALGDDDRPRFDDLLASALRRAGEARVTNDAIVGFDLSLFDMLGAAVIGAHGELLSSARLDNLVSCHAALVSLLSGPPATEMTRGIVLYDHEEVGSQSAAGASSLFLRTILGRLAEGYPARGSERLERSLAASFLVSADMAHAIHPNHPEKHDTPHAPRLGCGPVIKFNASQSYATDSPGAALFERACRAVGITPQRFVSRNDMRCGSTVGPISAARLGMRTVDVGSPMLGMHSCREMAATGDVIQMIQALAAVLEYPDVPAPSA